MNTPNLKPGETCPWCNSVGAHKAKPRLVCKVCGKPFTKGQKRRLFRGNWVHCDCV
jgi:hypothetical protein